MHELWQLLPGLAALSEVNPQYLEYCLRWLYQDNSNKKERGNVLKLGLVAVAGLVLAACFSQKTATPSPVVEPPVLPPAETQEAATAVATSPATETTIPEPTVSVTPTVEMLSVGGEYPPKVQAMIAAEEFDGQIGQFNGWLEYWARSKDKLVEDLPVGEGSVRPKLIIDLTKDPSQLKPEDVGVLFEFTQEEKTVYFPKKIGEPGYRTEAPPARSGPYGLAEGEAYLPLSGGTEGLELAWRNGDWVRVDKTSEAGQIVQYVNDYRQWRYVESLKFMNPADDTIRIPDDDNFRFDGNTGKIYYRNQQSGQESLVAAYSASQENPGKGVLKLEAQGEKGSKQFDLGIMEPIQIMENPAAGRLTIIDRNSKTGTGPVILIENGVAREVIDHPKGKVVFTDHGTALIWNKNGTTWDENIPPQETVSGIADEKVFDTYSRYANTNPYLFEGINDARIVSLMSDSTVGCVYQVMDGKPTLTVFKATKGGSVIPIRVDAFAISSSTTPKVYYLDETISQEELSSGLKILDLQLKGDEEHGGTISIWSPDPSNPVTQELAIRYFDHRYLARNISPGLPGTFGEIEARFREFYSQPAITSFRDLEEKYLGIAAKGDYLGLPFVTMLRIKN